MRILIVSGGSGGHIFPAIAVCRELAAARGVEITFVASRRRLDMELLEKETFRKRFFTINPMPRKTGLRTLVFLAKLFVDTVRSIFVLLTFRPRVVAGFGGYTGAPLIAVASMMRIPIVIHEQNVVPGLANRLLERFADKVCTSFEETGRYFKNKNIVCTGNPIRSRLMKKRDLAAALGLDPSRFTILAMGGSQGARSLNRLIVDAIGNMENGVRDGLQVVHIAGKHDSEAVSDAYKSRNVRNRTFSFIDSIEDAYGACDLAISRAGAAACFELSLFGKPMILIPFPDSGNNQRSNAQFFARHGACVYKEESELTPSGLRSIIEGLIKDPARRKELSSRAASFSRPDAAKRLASEIIDAL